MKGSGRLLFKFFDYVLMKIKGVWLNVWDSEWWLWLCIVWLGVGGCFVGNCDMCGCVVGCVDVGCVVGVVGDCDWFWYFCLVVELCIVDVGGVIGCVDCVLYGICFGCDGIGGVWVDDDWIGVGLYFGGFGVGLCFYWC